jgi:transketolase N-terminal domain/subunit
MRKSLLKYSFEHKLSHIPSALSMLDYVDVLFSDKFVVPYRDHIVVGKPFGSQTYYLIWQKLGYLNNIEKLNVGVKHEEIDFVDFSEETMGNALGVSIGIAISNPNERVWINVSDACLQMGNMLEAIQFIGHNKIKNIFLTIDYNNAQVTGKTQDILNVSPIVNMFENYGWNLQIVDGHKHTDIKKSFENLSNVLPNVIVFQTIKGKLISSMENDIKKWHYKKIETEEELQSLLKEL